MDICRDVVISFGAGKKKKGQRDGNRRRDEGIQVNGEGTCKG